MSVKGQLSASRDFLMVGMRAAERGSTRNDAAGKVVRACLDLVETLVRQSENVTASQVETTLAVLEKAVAEVDDETAATTAVVASIRNAIVKLQLLRMEISAR
ncbi:MAG: hypothetical protein HY047_10110 [Acidobacteria bacterium]|nr:hypothetical protein [Acidobacteriota bacterium]